MSMYSEDFQGEAILEAIEESRQLNAWCSKCDTHAEDCTCGRNDYLDDESKCINGNSGDETSPPDSPSTFPVPVLAESLSQRDAKANLEGDEARESTAPKQPIVADGSRLGAATSRGGENLLDTGGNEIPDRIEANEAWFKDEPIWNFNELKWKDGGAYYDPDEERGAEAEPYTHEEAEVRRREANE